MRKTIMYIGLALAGWEVVGRLCGPGSVFPPISSVVTRMYIDRGDYFLHLSSTLFVMMCGFILGNALGLCLAGLLYRSASANALWEGSMVFIFSTPLLILAFIIDSAFKNRTSGAVVFTALAVFFPTFENMRIGWHNVDGGLLTVVRAVGGNSWAEFAKVRWQSGLPAFAAALQASFPIAMLAAMLSDFTGAKAGLGKYLIGCLSQAQPERQWGIAILASLVAGGGYLLFAWAGSRSAAAVTASAPAEAVLKDDAAVRGPGGRQVPRALTLVLRGAFSFAIVPLCLWQSYAWALRGRLSAKGPADVITYLFYTGGGEGIRKLLAALPTTLGFALAGLGVSLLAALCLAAVLVLSESGATLLVPFVIVSQAVPILAWIPVLKLVVGKGFMLTIALAVSASFFPGVVFLSRAFTLISRDFRDLLRTYNASRWQLFRLVMVPGAVPYVIEAVYLVAPRVLLGVILAEYLVTYVGLGKLTYEARGAMDFGMLWAVGWITAIISGTLYVSMKQLAAMFGKRYDLGKVRP